MTSRSRRGSARPAARAAGSSASATAAPATRAATTTTACCTCTTPGGCLFGVRTRPEGTGYTGSRVRGRPVPTGLNDGDWHHVVGVLASDGMRLYVDGVQVGSRSDVNSGHGYYGYWRVGADTISSGWPSQPSSTRLNGDIDEAAVYYRPLTTARDREPLEPERARQRQHHPDRGVHVVQQRPDRHLRRRARSTTSAARSCPTRGTSVTATPGRASRRPPVRRRRHLRRDPHGHRQRGRRPAGGAARSRWSAANHRPRRRSPRRH